MSDLIRFAYISRSTLSNNELSNMQDIAEEILSVANVHNQNHGITGILCFSNNCYFQCLEGFSDAVLPLYEKIINDSRHTDIKIILKEPITTRSFAKWSMKYLPDVEVMIPLIRLHGHKTFNPYDFSQHLLLDLLDFLSQKFAEGKY